MLYFIPNCSSLSGATIRSLGLDYSSLGEGGREVRNGPGGQHGCVVAAAGSESSLGYFKDKQVWAAAPQGDAKSPPFWCGYDIGKVPTPESLARKEMISGTWVTFRNGSKWLVPKLRSWHLGEAKDFPVVYHVELPCLLNMDRYGLVTMGDVVPEYQEIFEAGMRIHARMAGGVSELTDQQWFQFGADLITMNYHVGLFELTGAVTGHLCIDDAAKVVKAGIDWEGFVETLGNAAGRLERPTINTDSGSAPLTLEELTSTNPPLVS